MQRLSGDFDRSTPQVMNMATGAGKTYVMAAFINTCAARVCARR
ncbi:DEAD/DEAH box helicase family protein [Corynebacterium diphtheriae]